MKILWLAPVSHGIVLLMASFSFPDDFLWGASISAHQVEGGNHNDWSEWELKNAAAWAAKANPKIDHGSGPLTQAEWRAVEPDAKNPANYISGQALDHYRLWQEDVALTKAIGLNSLRFSVEWSRVQPSVDMYDQAAIKHYVAMARELKNSGIEPIITLHHFTNPLWFVELGGWESKAAPQLFAAYVETMVQAFRKAGLQGIKYLTINEPEVYATQGWIFGVWPPEKHFSPKYLAVRRHLVQAHNRAYHLIKSLDKTAMVSFTTHAIDFEAKKNLLYPLNKLAILVGEWLVAGYFMQTTKQTTDFIALNHYLHCVVDLSKFYSKFGLFKNKPTELRSDTGWYMEPKSMLRVLKRLKHFHKPVYITENGIAARDDTLRQKYIRAITKELQAAIQAGVPLKGYLHWSLLDAFEWPVAGWWAQFGLVAVDRKTMQRHSKPSAALLGDLAKNHQL